MSEHSECEQQIEMWAEQLKNSSPGSTFLVQGGGTKPALLPWSWQTSTNQASDPGRPASESRVASSQIQTAGLRGIIEYQPAEFTITAYAGTPISELLAVLAAHGQYLPFEPPYHPPTQLDSRAGHLRSDLAGRTTIGGTVAAGVNGPGRMRHGGLRDFLLEVRYIDGQGVIRRGGRRVVKNAAGFDIPKLMVGSCGRLGVLVDVTLKVFPRPRDYLTLHVLADNIDATVEILTVLLGQPWDLDAVEVQTDGSVLIRIAGYKEALIRHGQRIQSRLNKYSSSFISGEQQQQVWEAHADWLWGRQDQCLVKVPLALRQIFELDEALEELEVQRGYGSGGNVAWLQWSTVFENQVARLKRLHKVFSELKLCGQVLQAPTPQRLCGHAKGSSFLQRLKSVFDPHDRLGSFDVA